MGSGFYKDYKNAIEQIRKEAESVAVARARYRVQDDFNRELIEEIANKTGHPNLAASCFVRCAMRHVPFLCSRLLQVLNSCCCRQLQ